MLSKRLKIVYLLAAVLLLAIAVYAYLAYQKYHPSTDDAYVQAHIVNIAAQVSGPVSAIYVKNHMQVHKGQPLFTIDSAPFEIALHQAQASLENTEQQIKAEEDAVKTAEALVNQRQAELTDAEKNAYRIKRLVKQGLFPIAEGDDATRRLLVAQAALAAANSQLSEARQKLGQAGDNNAQLKVAKAAVQKAKLDLGYTQVTAPNDGYIVKFTLRQGSMVTAQQALFSLVENNQWWVDANFKETELARIKAGQSAKITVDMYPGISFTGKVDSISRGSGSAFSILPPENATGNWVKVTQRIPVKVLILDPNPDYPLRVGTSSIVRINTR